MLSFSFFRVTTYRKLNGYPATGLRKRLLVRALYLSSRRHPAQGAALSCTEVVYHGMV